MWSRPVFLCAVARAVNIPSRLGLVIMRNHGAPPETVEAMGHNLFYHGYAELYLNGKWIKATPAFNQELCLKHNILPVDFDGVHDAVFPARDLSGRPYVEYLEDLGVYADIPLEKLLEGWRKLYGPERIQAWIDRYNSGS